MKKWLRFTVREWCLVVVAIGLGLGWLGTERESERRWADFVYRTQKRVRAEQIEHLAWHYAITTTLNDEQFGPVRQKHDRHKKWLEDLDKERWPHGFDEATYPLRP